MPFGHMDGGLPIPFSKATLNLVLENSHHLVLAQAGFLVLLHFLLSFFFPLVSPELCIFPDYRNDVLVAKSETEVRGKYSGSDER